MWLGLLLCWGTVACAEQPSLPVQLKKLVEQEGLFADYSVLTADDATLAGKPKDVSVFVMHKGDCCVLFVACETEGAWNLEGYTRQCLYPTQAENSSMRIQILDSQRFQLGWEGERYTFYARGGENYGCLEKAEFQQGDTVVTARYVLSEPDQYGIRYSEGLLFDSPDGTSVCWKITSFDYLDWRSCNPMLIPKDGETAERCSRIAQLYSRNGFHTSFHVRIKNLRRNVTVYSLPDKKSQEVDSSFLMQNDSFSIYGNLDKWHLIGYQNGMERAYIGYIPASKMPLSKREKKMTALSFKKLPMMTVEDTFLTDDPLLSQHKVVDIPCGITVTGFASWDPYYLYVEMTIDGETIRGFVPIRSLVVSQY